VQSLTLTSQRSGSSASIATISRPSLALGDAVIAQELVDGEPHGDGAAVAHRLLGILDDLAQQPDAVFEAAAILVGTLVAPLLQEMHGQRDVVAGIAVDNVEADLAGAQCGGACQLR